MTTNPARARASAGRGRTAYLVLGMHRSGTSAVTQVLALAGAQLPQNVMAGDEHNARGYFEPWRIALFNDQRLRAVGSAWDDIFAFPYRPLEGREERAWLNRAESLFSDEYGDVTYPLLKDPRVAVLLPFWRQLLDELGIGTRAVIPVRHPLAVAASLARRNGFSGEKSVLLWSAYMLAAEAYTRDVPRAFVSYDGLLADWRGELARIVAAHGAALPRMTEKAAREIDAFLTPELRHNASDAGLGTLGWAGALTTRVLAWFESAAAGAAPPTEPLATAAAELARRSEDMGPLISLLTRDLDATRAELTELRQRFAHEQRQARRTALELQALRGEAAAAISRLDAVLADD
ncbi:MAG: sulfotransferase family protein [Phenylobacterium sp.]